MNNMLFSRCNILAQGALAGVGIAGAVGLEAIASRPSLATSDKAMQNDAKILNKALYYKYQAIWAYSFAAGKLSDTEVGKALLALALSNQKDHMAHRDVLADAVKSLGGTPIGAESHYDLSSYLDRGEGNIDSDVNIAKLALALETDAAIAYTQESAPAAVRATFKALGVDRRNRPCCLR